MTEYFFWPRNDAWDEVKAAMETKPYISERLAPCPVAFTAGWSCQLLPIEGACRISSNDGQLLIDAAACNGRQPLSCRQRIDLLNKVTQVIRLWENDEQGRLPIEEARAAMPEISFVGS